MPALLRATPTSATFLLPCYLTLLRPRGLHFVYSVSRTQGRGFVALVPFGKWRAYARREHFKGDGTERWRNCIVVYLHVKFIGVAEGEFGPVLPVFYSGRGVAVVACG